ncbi:partitioning defective 3 homolog B isoform X2 [Hyla sarda]|uniref:partitioning defective 3 homolog B isoform X2 n=1 Tax=Hyla sarda TaxID=327740 RepID=UPI0024C42715|nr:partitioning defective 3 homolog B isoform X2 [Hyla sarda]
MKVTVCFGKTGIVVPCKDGKISVRELIQQAAQRYIKAKEKEPGYWVKIHHLEYKDGGILDPDDIVSDVVEDKDKLIAVFDEQDASSRTDNASNITDHLSPEIFKTDSQHQPLRGEIEVTSSALKLGTPLLVRRSSDPTVGPVADFHPGSSHTAEQNMKLAIQGRSVVLTEDQRDVTWQEEHMRLQKYKYMQSDLTRKVEISGDDGPLGIHVVPFYSSLSGRALGLYIRGIEENSRTKRDGLFEENECIVKINKVDLIDKSFTQAQDIFRQAMKHPNVLVEVVPSHTREMYEKAFISALSVLDSYDEDDEVPNIKPPPPPTHRKLNAKIVEQNNDLELAQLLHPSLVPDLSSNVGAYSPPSLSPLGFGSKRYAKRIRIDLKKGPDGLGFTVVTRDSTVHGPGPIFVKNILPKGAAIKDGRLQSGDRIIEVKGQAIAGKTQEELVAMLRSTKLGETVSLVVARQEDAFLPRELKCESESHVVSPEKVTQMTFEIPLNDSGSAGLGISLKGNKSRDTSTDLGIFIKSIIHGGAAFKDGRLRVNDQLVAVNGESLLSKSNQEAMGTLRRSMSMEGNIRGMIQLVILRKLEKQTEARLESEPVFRKNFENPTIEYNGLQDKTKGSANFDDGSLEKDVPPPLPPHPNENIIMEYSNFSSGMESSQQPDTYNLKTSKSMDLVADESNVMSINGHKEDSPGKDLGPRLGLKKSSSLESLQTAVAEVKKNELPFYRPRPHMVRGRGCNESFRAAIDKSYDGPESDEDGLSDVSSHSDREIPNSEQIPMGNPDLNDNDKEKKDKKKKDKKKEKGKSKVKDKKKKEESEEQDRKSKKKGFGAMLRFGKKNKDDRGGKLDQKDSPRPGTLKEEEQEVEKIREERERINAKHQELREKQAKVLWNLTASHDIEDDDMDPNYARVNHFKEPPLQQHNSHRTYSPVMAGSYGYPRETLLSASERDHVQDLYAKVNKKQQAPDAVDSGHSTSGNVDRIQQLRMEYQQAKREGFPLYDSEDAAGRFLEYEQSWAPARGPSGCRNLSFEGIERQYASLPRPVAVEPVEYMTSPRAMYNDREPPYYYDVASPSTKGTYPRSQSHQEENYRFPPYHPSTAKGPLRQDVPPSPPQAHRSPGYGTGGRLGQDRYKYRTQDPRQKNSMTAAV